MHRNVAALPGGDHGFHRRRIFGAEIEDVAHFNTARRHLLIGGNGGELVGFMHLGGRGILRRPFVENGLQVFAAVEIHVLVRHRHVEKVLVTEHFRLAGIGEDDEFMAEIAADRPGVGAHRDRFQAKPREGAQVGNEHLAVGMLGAGLVDVERIGILHQEFAAAHQAETRAHLVAEFPLDMIEIERQILVRADIGAEDLGDHLFVRGTKEHVALVPVLDAQHLLAIRIVTAALAPQIGRLHGRHQQLDGAGTVLLLAHDGADLVEHPQTERQEGINARGFLAHHAGAQHKAVRDDLGLARRLFQDRQEVAGQAHGISRDSRVSGPRVKADRAGKDKGTRHPEVPGGARPRRATARKNVAVHPSRLATLALQDDGFGLCAACPP